MFSSLAKRYPQPVVRVEQTEDGVLPGGFRHVRLRQNQWRSIQEFA